MRGRVALASLAAVALLAGCGSARHPPGDRIHGRVLTIYFSGPTHGASSLGAAAALNAARLALSRAHSRIGVYRIRLRTLDDSTPQSGSWDPNQTTLDARIAAQDPTTVGYLGDFNSGASAISIPLLNRLGIAQVSPWSSSVGLTSAGPGAAPGEPEKYYPTDVRTFARVVPTDARQAVALVKAERAVGCSSSFVLEDGEVDGEDAALTFLLTAQSAGVRVIAIQAFQRQATDYTGLARSVAASGADCVLVSTIDEPSAVRLTEAVVHALPRATIFATSDLANQAYVNPSRGGLPSSLDAAVVVVNPALPPSAYPQAGRQFLAEYSRQFGAPEPPAIFGYEAMSLMLSAIARATGGGHRAADRSKVRAELFSDRPIDGTVGVFHIDRNGDTSLPDFGIYRLTAGHLSFWMRTG